MKHFLLGLLFVTALAWTIQTFADGAVVIPQCKTPQELKRHWMWRGDYAVTCGVTRVVMRSNHEAIAR